MPNKVLVAYYSHSGNTAKAAAAIAQKIGAELLEIVPVEAYPQEHSGVVERAKQEIHQDIKPPIRPVKVEVSGFDLVIAGTPNWCATLASPVATFLASNDWKGKKLAIFCTHGGGGMSKVEQDAKRLCPDADWLPAAAIRDGDVAQSVPELKDWLASLGC